MYHDSQVSGLSVIIMVIIITGDGGDEGLGVFRDILREVRSRHGRNSVREGRSSSKR